jgi:hypothetical protein
VSNTKRPPLQRQHTRSTEKKRDAALDVGLTIVVDGAEYTVRQGDLTSLDTMALRRETGFSFRSLLVSFQQDPDVDLVAALVWLARRIAGEQMLSYAEVAQEIGYDVDIDVKDPDEADESPEA